MFKKLHTLEKYFCFVFFGCLQFALCFVLSFHRFVLFLAFLRPIYNNLLNVFIHFVFVPSLFYFVFSIKLPFFIPFFKMATFDFLSFLMIVLVCFLPDILNLCFVFDLNFLAPSICCCSRRNNLKRNCKKEEIKGEWETQGNKT